MSLRTFPVQFTTESGDFVCDDSVEATTTLEAAQLALRRLDDEDRQDGATLVTILDADGEPLVWSFDELQ